MSQAAVIDALNRLLALQHRSLPMFLLDARPWTHRGDERASAALAHVVEDQKSNASRIAEAILDRGGAIDSGDFSIEWTDLHDLSLDYLIGQLIAQQQSDIAEIAALVPLAAEDSAARQLVEETLGAEKGHLESLQELSRQPALH